MRCHRCNLPKFNMAGSCHWSSSRLLYIAIGILVKIICRHGHSKYFKGFIVNLIYHVIYYIKYSFPSYIYDGLYMFNMILFIFYTIFLSTASSKIPEINSLT